MYFTSDHPGVTLDGPILNSPAYECFAQFFVMLKHVALYKMGAGPLTAENN
jgi:hypothetical protein